MPYWAFKRNRRLCYWFCFLFLLLFVIIISFVTLWKLHSYLTNMKPNINTGLFSVEALWKNSEIWWGDAQYHAADNNWKLQARSFFRHSMKLPWHFRKYQEIALLSEIWWHGEIYHEEDYYFKWPRSASVRIFWSRPAEGAVVPWTSCLDCTNNTHTQIHPMASSWGPRVSTSVILSWLPVTSLIYTVI